MPIPDFQSLMLPLLEVLADGQERAVRDVTNLLADRFGLTPEERQQLLPSGQNRVFVNRVAWAKALLSNELDGSKGVNLSFRPWDGQLRQPLLLTDGQAVIGSAPIDGMLHPRQTLDTLGADAPEKLCKARG